VGTRILLLRHAQSVWNAEGRWQGWADPPLSPSGEAAAAAAAADPAFDPIDGAVSSDLERARRTADIIAGLRGWPPAGCYRGLRERGAGLWTGLTRAEVEEGWPGALEGRVATIPGGEAAAAATSRAVATLHRIAEAWPGQAVLAVTHGALIRLVEAHSGGRPVAVPNLAGRWVEVTGGVIVLGPVTVPEAPMIADHAG
jgi:broad specificity phosphatase PhoE